MEDSFIFLSIFVLCVALVFYFFARDSEKSIRSWRKSILFLAAGGIVFAASYPLVELYCTIDRDAWCFLAGFTYVWTLAGALVLIGLILAAVNYYKSRNA